MWGAFSSSEEAMSRASTIETSRTVPLAGHARSQARACSRRLSLLHTYGHSDARARRARRGGIRMRCARQLVVSAVITRDRARELTKVCRASDSWRRRDHPGARNHADPSVIAEVLTTFVLRRVLAIALLNDITSPLCL